MVAQDQAITANAVKVKFISNEDRPCVGCAKKEESIGKVLSECNNLA